MTEDELGVELERAAQGDRGSFTRVVEQHHQQVFRWAVVATGDLDEAEDLEQQVWIQVYRGLKSWRARGKFSTWLYRITFNLAEQERRTRERRLRLLSRQQFTDGVVNTDTTRLDAERLVGIIKGYLSGLSPRQQQVFTMVDLEGVPTGEIAERLGISEATVRVTLYKARQAIRQRLEREQPALVREYQE